ncbi:MAG: type II secretion system F family protein [Wenzhouxiangella sp.]|nr:type II secretion system F family protein [Wenzhouxiangella sp.]TVR95789.1 MAG: type II secretion system F family protein [Wenzhouxiangellaceae bacterium]
MSAFVWQGRNARGQLVSGRVEADDVDRVAEQLLRIDITPISIDQIVDTRRQADSLSARLGLDKPGLNDLILFSRQMYTMTRAGVPLIQGLKNVGGSTRNRQLAEAIDRTLEALESGRGLAAGLALSPRIFPPMYVSIVRVGETSGALEQAFLQMASHLELERDFRARMKAALRYPVMVVIAMFIAVAILMIWVVPVFANFFARQEAELPLPTRIIIGTSDFAVSWWWLILLVLVGSIFAFRTWIRSDNGRYLWDRSKLRMPIIGKILFQGTLARFARSFAMTYRAGVPLIQGLTLVSRAVENEYVGQAVADMRTGIERGESVSRTAQATGLFTPLVLQMISVGEETGEVENMLQETAEFYEREVDYDLRNLGAYIEPILLIFLAVLVLILALGVFLPMWDLGSAALG